MDPEDFFSDPQIRFTIDIYPEWSHVHTKALDVPVDPEKCLRQAIAALEAELEDLKNCPVHGR